MKRIIKLIVEIDTDEDFNLDELAVGKYAEDTTADAQTLLITEGKIGQESYFKVTDYIKVEDITQEIEDKKQQLIGVTYMNRRFYSNADYDEVFETFDDDEKESINKESKQNI
jgi:hypothetical protein